MKVLVVGATGATGSLLVKELLKRGIEVIAIVRSSGKFEGYPNNDLLKTVKASILDVADEELSKIIEDCDAAVSCLGHNLTFKGMYGNPRKLVRDASMKICNALEGMDDTKKRKFLLMNTAGNINKDANEKVSFLQNMVLGIIRFLVPPHADNEQAAEFLRTKLKNSKSVEWTVVRPDTLINEDEPTEYKVHPSPTRSAIFNAGKTSRVNVAYFMAELICKEILWEKWKGKMPVLYNKED